MPAFYDNPTGAAVMTCYVDGVPDANCNYLANATHGWTNALFEAVAIQAVLNQSIANSRVTVDFNYIWNSPSSFTYQYGDAIGVVDNWEQGNLEFAFSLNQYSGDSGDMLPAGAAYVLGKASQIAGPTVTGLAGATPFVPVVAIGAASLTPTVAAVATVPKVYVTAGHLAAGAAVAKMGGGWPEGVVPKIGWVLQTLWDLSPFGD
jgi:hypothetical protein